MVVVRQGNHAGGSSLALSSFDNQLWEKMMELECLTNWSELDEKQIRIYPNPVSGELSVQHLPKGSNLSLFTIEGSQILETSKAQFDLSFLSRGVYILKITSLGRQRSFRIVKQ